MANNAGEYLRMGAGLGSKVAIVTAAESGIGKGNSRPVRSRGEQ